MYIICLYYTSLLLTHIFTLERLDSVWSRGDEKNYILNGKGTAMLQFFSVRRSRNAPRQLSAEGTFSLILTPALKHKSLQLNALSERD